ncbi:MAG: hypothetical protein H6765_03020 [Candidatus Peribacteria bacterium]|nr:MAG: hypothetical protein H6765_03020 [Candidatus Peribacteria bacterium]
MCDWDGTCDSPCETAETCPIDCNACGNGVCEPGENHANCVSDCPNATNCGNWQCESGETYINCSQDCALCEREIQEFIFQE